MQASQKLTFASREKTAVRAFLEFVHTLRSNLAFIIDFFHLNPYTVSSQTFLFYLLSKLFLGYCSVESTEVPNSSTVYILYRGSKVK